MPNFLVNTDKKLQNIISEIKSSRIIGLDTEFIRESTYFPKLALLQIATNNNNYCIDVINIADKNLLIDILVDEDIIKVIHSSKQDLESIFTYYKYYPKNIFDTQIAFNFLHNETNPSYSKLVKKYFEVPLKEGSWRTNWLQRPLSEEKIEYACNDVKYLIKLHHILYEQLQREQKLDWCIEEICNDLEIDNVIVKPRDIWKRLNLPNKINNHQLVTLKKVAELRENEAIDKDIPRKWIMSDTLMIKISTCKTNQLDQVISDTKIKLSTRILEKIKEIIMKNDTILIKNNNSIDIDEYHKLIEKCNNIMDSIAAQYNIAPSFIANKKDIENFARGNKNVRFLKGWRFNIFGKLVQ
tara:strand:+ start:3370 stop:4434 length:1065 start_codon:yes stop_codon:yes gene_type:complete